MSPSLWEWATLRCTCLTPDFTYAEALPKRVRARLGFSVLLYRPYENRIFDLVKAYSQLMSTPEKVKGWTKGWKLK